MTPSVLVLGSTDTTIAVAEGVIAGAAAVAAVVSVGESFSISYSAQPVRNRRSANLAEWCAVHEVPLIPFDGYEKLRALLEETSPELCLVAGWYHMVPRWFRELFPRGCLGFHASLLPQLRGGAPLNWAILSDLQETGVTLFQLTDGIDDGPYIAQDRFPIGRRSTIAELAARANEACLRLSSVHVPRIMDGQCGFIEQAGEPSYSLQRDPDDGWIVWSMSAEAIDRLIRAVSKPYPGAFTSLNGETITIWLADVAGGVQVFGRPGQIVRLPGMPHPLVKTGSGLLAILEATDQSGASALDKLLKSGHMQLGKRAV